MSYLLVGMTAPNKITITITNSPQTAAVDDLDLSGFDYCRLLVRKPTGTEDVFWEATTVTPSTDAVVVTYEFEAGDLSEAGCYVVKPRLSTTPFYQPAMRDTVELELNPVDVRHCANVDVEVYAS